LSKHFIFSCQFSILQFEVKIRVFSLSCWGITN